MWEPGAADGCASQVLVVAVCLPFLDAGSATDADWAVLAALGVGQMGLGLALLTVGARLIPPAQVAVISLLEIVLGPLWEWLAYEERPSAATVAGGVVVVAAVVVQAWSPGRTARDRELPHEAVSEAHVCEPSGRWLRAPPPSHRLAGRRDP